MVDGANGLPLVRVINRAGEVNNQDGEHAIVLHYLTEELNVLEKNQKQRFAAHKDVQVSNRGFFFN